MDSRNRDNRPSGIFFAFLKLGCIAFGGPIAHLGYFREEFVRKRQWLGDEAYADLVALCQFLPGPASSQVGFAIGLRRGGITGAFAAWTGFTLPSAILMLGFALGLQHFGDISEAGWVMGLKLAAVAVVANAIWNMASKLCPDRARALLAIGVAAFLIVAPSAIYQVGMIVMGMGVGWLLFRWQVPGKSADGEAEPPRDSGWPWLAAFGLLLVGLPVIAQILPEPLLRIFDVFYRAGSLVFGGGHVVLPLLDAFTVGQGWIARDTFLAGYGAAQALPGPLFAFSAFLGASLESGSGGIFLGLLALLAIYLPSWLLVLGVAPYWERLRKMPGAQAALMGANAAVVGLLLAAFYDPIWTSAIRDAPHLAFALIGFALLRYGRLPPWALVAASGTVGHFLF